MEVHASSTHAATMQGDWPIPLSIHENSDEQFALTEIEGCPRAKRVPPVSGRRAASAYAKINGISDAPRSHKGFEDGIANERKVTSKEMT